MNTEQNIYLEKIRELTVKYQDLENQIKQMAKQLYTFKKAFENFEKEIKVDAWAKENTRHLSKDTFI